jgi:ribosomal protein S25
MGLIDHINLLDRIHHHIEHKSTGAPGDFASRLGISQSKLYRILAELRYSGIEIIYDSNRESYVYTGSAKIDSLMKALRGKVRD